MAKEYIEKKDVMGAIARLESENNCGTSDFIEAKRIAYEQVKEAINSIPAQGESTVSYQLLGWKENQEPKGFDKAYLDEKIALAEKSWRGVDADQFLAEVRGEAEQEVDLEAEFKKWWKGTEGKINIEHSMYWYMKDCARHFHNLSHKHNGFKWHKFSEQLPPLGVPVLAFHHNWINSDFNPEGIRIGHLQENCSSYDGKYDFCSAHWWDYQDCFVTISKSDVEGKEQGFSEDIVNSIMPEYWVELPMFNHKHQ